jgi:hypothetical protein
MCFQLSDHTFLLLFRFPSYIHLRSYQPTTFTPLGVGGGGAFPLEENGREQNNTPFYTHFLFFFATFFCLSEKIGWVRQSRHTLN